LPEASTPLPTFFHFRKDDTEAKIFSDHFDRTHLSRTYGPGVLDIVAGGRIITRDEL
jgi:hypothetical protein